MEKYLYFRAGATLATDDDNAEGSNLYPVSSFVGMEATSDTTSTLYFKGKKNDFSGGATTAVIGINDSVVITHNTNKQKAVMSALAKAINYGGSDNMIVVADDVDSVYVSDEITSVANFDVRVVNA